VVNQNEAITSEESLDQLDETDLEEYNDASKNHFDT